MKEKTIPLFNALQLSVCLVSMMLFSLRAAADTLSCDIKRLNEKGFHSSSTTFNSSTAYQFEHDDSDFLWSLTVVGTPLPTHSTPLLQDATTSDSNTQLSQKAFSNWLAAAEKAQLIDKVESSTSIPFHQSHIHLAHTSALNGTAHALHGLYAERVNNYAVLYQLLATPMAETMPADAMANAQTMMDTIINSCSVIAR